MVPLGDRATQAIEYALGALERRAEVTAHNVSNAEVPNYQASRLDFEAALREAIDRGRIQDLGVPVAESAGGVPNSKGNTVDIEEEMVEMLKTNLLQGALVEAYNFKTGLLRTAIRGQ